MYPSNNEHIVAWNRQVIGRGVQQQTTELKLMIISVNAR